MTQNARAEAAEEWTGRLWCELGYRRITCRRIVRTIELTSAQHGRTLQRPPFRSRNKRPLRALVSALQISFRDLVEMMAERGLLPGAHDDHALDSTLCARIRNAGTASLGRAGRSWRVDETYVKIKGRWTYLYRAVDKEGRTVDFLLRAKRDVAAAKAFFRLAFRRQGRLPLKITLDGYQASHRAAKEALDEHPEGNQCKIRSSKYFNDS